jgi:hypothetical protein
MEHWKITSILFIGIDFSPISIRNGMRGQGKHSTNK